MIPLISLWDKRRSLGVHLYQKDPRLIKKWLSYGYFSTERLDDSIENQIEQKETLGCAFKQKRSKIGPERAELWLFSHWDVVWFHLEPQGTNGDPRAFIICALIVLRIHRNTLSGNNSVWVSTVIISCIAVVLKCYRGRQVQVITSILQRIWPLCKI